MIHIHQNISDQNVYVSYEGATEFHTVPVLYVCIFFICELLMVFRTVKS
jgi:hypothetical protein